MLTSAIAADLTDTGDIEPVNIDEDIPVSVYSVDNSFAKRTAEPICPSGIIPHSGVLLRHRRIVPVIVPYVAPGYVLSSGRCTLVAKTSKNEQNSWIYQANPEKRPVRRPTTRKSTVLNRLWRVPLGFQQSVTIMFIIGWVVLLAMQLDDTVTLPWIVVNAPLIAMCVLVLGAMTVALATDIVKRGVLVESSFTMDAQKDINRRWRYLQYTVFCGPLLFFLLLLSLYLDSSSRSTAGGADSSLMHLLIAIPLIVGEVSLLITMILTSVSLTRRRAAMLWRIQMSEKIIQNIGAIVQSVVFALYASNAWFIATWNWLILLVPLWVTVLMDASLVLGTILYGTLFSPTWEMNKKYLGAVTRSTVLQSGLISFGITLVLKLDDWFPNLLYIYVVLPILLALAILALLYVPLWSKKKDRKLVEYTLDEEDALGEHSSDDESQMTFPSGSLQSSLAAAVET